jgi:uncharacterized coiled-coil DUF342 family protein
MKFASLYGLFALISIVLFNVLILLARFVRQAKSPPADEDFEKLVSEKNELKVQAEQEHAEALQLKDRLQQLEEANKKLEDSLQLVNQELEALKKAPAPAPAQQAG